MVWRENNKNKQKRAPVWCQNKTLVKILVKEIPLICLYIINWIITSWLFFKDLILLIFASGICGLELSVNQMWNFSSIFRMEPLGMISFFMFVASGGDSLKRRLVYKASRPRSCEAARPKLLMLFTSKCPYMSCL